MSTKIQKISIRLLKSNLNPMDALREGADLKDWAKLPGSKIFISTIGGQPPKWAGFLQLDPDEIHSLFNNFAIAVLFIRN